MAQSKMVNMVDEIITCSICVELTEDPRMLRCQHTFCFDCLVQYMRNKAIQHEIECPVCRKWCPLPNGKVDELPVSFLYNQLKDAKKVTSFQQREAMDENVSPRCFCSSPGCPYEFALVYCDTCGYICDECQDNHYMPCYAGHVMIPLDKAVEQRLGELPTCTKHPHEIMTMYCDDCNRPMCSLCYPNSHFGHRCAEIIDRSSAAKCQLRRTVETVDMYLEKSTKLTYTIKEHFAMLENTFIDMKRQVALTMNTMHHKVAALKTATNQDIHAKYLQKMKSADVENERIQKLRKTLESIKVSSVNILLYGKPYDILQHMSSIQKRLEEHNPDKITLTLQNLDVEEARQQLENIHFFDQPTLHVTQTERKFHKHQKMVHELKRDLKKEKEHMVNAKKTYSELNKRYKKLDKCNKSNKQVISSIQFDLIEEKKETCKLKKTIDTLRGNLKKERGDMANARKIIFILAIVVFFILPTVAPALQANMHLLVLVVPVYYMYLTSKSGNAFQPNQSKWNTHMADNVITIECDIPGGKQNSSHPRPGVYYRGDTLTAELPNSLENQETVRLLKKAFDAGILITVKNNRLCWNARIFDPWSVQLSSIRERLAFIGIE